MTEPNEAPAGPAPEESEAESSAGELNIGPRVTAVFTAAEKAAQHIVTMAREEADDLRRRAEAEAETLLSQRRYQAEEEASRRLADAQAQADQIRTAAEEEARQIAETAHRRELRIREETRLLEERVEWAREGLGEVLARLREAEFNLAGSPAGEPPSVPSSGTENDEAQ